MAERSGRVARLLIGESDPPTVDIAAEFIGLDSFSRRINNETFEVGGGGRAMAEQASGHYEESGTWPVDENDSTRSLFIGRAGATFHVWLEPSGNNSGGKRLKWSGPLGISHTYSAGGKRRFNLTMDFNGRVTSEDIA